MSELQRQLEAHRSTSFQQISLKSNVPSLFFTSKEAGLIDIDVVYEAAVEGIHFLNQYDSRFRPFLENILHPSSKSLQRELQTNEEKKVLDSKIEDLLHLLSLYSAEPQCHKILEFLIRRYRVHEFNGDDLLKCMITQHDTKIFARVVQLTNITSTVWAFLEPYKTSGSPLPRAVLAKKCSKDNVLLTKLTSVAFSSLRLATLNCSKTSQSRISAVIAYYTALALDVIEDSQELSDQLLRNFFLYILGGISGKIPSEYEFSENLNENTQESWLQSACMLISQISRRVNLSRTILNSLLVSLTQRIRSKVDISGSGYISQHNDDDNIDILDHSVENILMVVIILVRYQKVRITGSILQTMFVDYHPPYETSFIVLRCIENLRLRHNADVSSTLAAILHGVAKELFHFSGIDGLDDSKIENLNFLLEIFKNVVATGQVEISAVMSSLKTLLSQYLDSSINYHDSNNDLEKNIFEITCELLRFVSQRYSLEFDKTIKSFMEEKSTQLSLVKFQHLLNAAFHHAVYHKIQDNGLGLFLSLNDSSEIIRREGLQVFGKIFGQSGTINKDDEDLRSLAQSVVKLFETDLYNNETMLLLFTYDVLSPLFKILPDQVQDIVDNIPFSLAHLYHRLSVDLKALDAIISLLQSLYHQDLLRDLCSEGSSIDFLLNKLFGILLFIASMIKTMPDDSCKILDAFTLALDNLSQYFPLLSNKLSSHISSDVQPYLQVISLITQRSTPRLIENSSNCLPLLIRLYFVIHQYQTAILVNDQQREGLRILYEQTFLSLLDLSLSLCENLIPKSKTTQGRNSLIAILSLTMSWININYNYKIYGVLQLSQATFLSMNLVLLKLFNFWKQLHPVTDRKLNHSIDDCFVGYISFPSHRSLSFQLLLSLLSLIASGEDVAQVASGLKSCLETFFPNDYVTVLITIATADISAQSPHNLPGTGSLDDNFQNYESQLLFDDEHRSIFSPHFAFQPTEKAETYITSTAQLSALDTLAGYLSHLKSMSDVCVVSLLPLILSNLQSESQEIRQATADLLSSIVNRTENHRSISTFLKGKNSIPTVTINDFYRAISDILQKTPHDLPMMISTLQTVLNSYPDVISILFNVIRVLNWKRPTLTSRIFLVTVSKQTFTSIWNSCSKYLLDLVPVYNHETADSFRQLAHLIVAMSNQSFLNSQSDCKNGAQINDLTECYLKFLHDRSEKTLSSTICHEILQSISRVSKDKTWVDALPLTDREVLFVGMMEELERNAQVDFQTPLCSIIIPMDLGFKYLRQAFESIRDIFKKYSVVSEEISPENGDVHLNGGGVSQPTVRGHKLVTNLTIPLQKLGWEIEIISSLYRKLMEEIEIISIDHPDYSTLSQSCCVLFDLLHMLNTQQIKKILSVNYLRNNILELLCYSISKLKIQINSSKSKTQTKSSSSSSSSSNIYYSSERIQNDIQRIFKCLELSTTLDTQKYSLELLSLLLNISPSHIHSTILLLTKILSGNILSNTISFENTNNLVSNILKAVISISNSHQESSSSIVLPQDILEPYFHTYQMISSQKRIALLSIISERYDPTIAPICISLLLSHVLISYSMIDESRDQNISEKENDEIFILLSRSAQRKANRMIRTSQSEEFFNLALRYNLQFANPSNQINCLIVMTNIVKKLFSISLESHSNGHGHDLHPHPHQSEENIAVEYSGCTQYLFSPVQYIKYTNSFLSNENSMNSSNTTPAMIVLQLEYILEFIENSSFHDHLLSILFDSSTGSLTNFGYEIQKLFLLFSESILELLSYLTYLQHHYSSKKNSSSLFSINLKNQHIIISSKEFLKYSSNLCLNIMHSLQNLLDGPTFVVILQELLSNENISIRQKSLEILSDRLQNLDRRRGKIDMELYLDLSTRLRSTVMTCLSTENGKLQLNFSGLGLSQSALLCIDLIARKFMKQKEWIKPMNEYLGEFVKLSEKIASEINSGGFNENQSSHQEDAMKLLGSAFLCCGTLSAISRTKALPFLATLVGELLKVIELNREKLHNLEGHTWTREENVMIKTRVLLIRSCLSTLGALTTDLSGFFHPYLPKVLQILLPLMSSKHFPDSAVLVNDTNSYLSTLIKSIPKRLCIPALVQVTPILFSLGHDVSYHYCRFLQQLWLSLERNDVVNHLMSLQSICLYGFQYREMYEGKKEEISSSLNVDEAICESIIEICLKYTEKELKNYLLQLYHWTEENIDETKTNDEGKEEEEEEEEEEGRKEWLRYCRCKIFFQFVSELEKKLQNIFVPLMGIIWEYASEQILKYLQFIQQHPRSQLSLNDEVDENSKKTKKRKRSTTATTTTTTISVDNTGMNSHKYQLIRNELHETSIWILESVRLCCIHDNIHFIDQIQYDFMMPNISSLLSLSQSFSDENSYMEYALEYVLPCIVQLVIAVGKDVLWKPLNHKILQMTRNKKKCVRIVALKSLQRLFTEVGEEYLLLLPECLSYLSELLEDDSTEIVALTSEVIQNIEELSGESLDSYLR